MSYFVFVIKFVNYRTHLEKTVTGTFLRTLLAVKR